MNIDFVLFVAIAALAGMATNYFIRMKKMSWMEWAMINACSVFDFIYVFGCMVYYLSGNPFTMYLAFFGLAYYGGGGLYMTPWNGVDGIIAQAGHSTMVLICLRLVYRMLFYKFPTFMNLVVMLLLFVGFHLYQNAWCQSHRQMIKKHLHFDPPPSLFTLAMKKMK